MPYYRPCRFRLSCMPPTLSAVASTASRNLVPLAGVLLFGWSPPNLLALYYVDTLFALAALLLLVMAHVTGFDGRHVGISSPGLWLKGAAGAIIGALLIGVPLGVPLVMVLADYDWSVHAAFADRGFATGVAVQAALSAWQFVLAHRELDVRTDDERVLKHRAGFVFARWFVLLIAAMTGVPSLLGPRLGGFLLLAVYAGASIYFELHPERALAWLNPEAAATKEGGARKGAAPEDPSQRR